MDFKGWLLPAIFILLALTSFEVEGKKPKSRKRYQRGKHFKVRHGPTYPNLGNALEFLGVTTFPATTPTAKSSSRTKTGHHRKPNKVKGRTDLPWTGAPCPTPEPKEEKFHQGFTELWREVKYLSNPIHIHVDGGDSARVGCVGGDGQGHGSKGHGHGAKGHGHGHGHGHEGSAKSRGPTPKHTAKGHDHGRTAKGRRHDHGSKSRGSPGSKGKRSPHGSKSKSTHHKSQSRTGSGTRRNGRHNVHNTHIHVHVTVGNNGSEPDTHQHKECRPPKEYVYARCDLVSSDPKSALMGTVFMRQKEGELMQVKVNISGVPRSKADAGKSSLHGLHVHQYADFSQGCASFGGHFNPEGIHHDSHVGDWGNVQCDGYGQCEAEFNATKCTLYGGFSAAGRGIVFHAKEDDMGKGGDAGSLKTGNAGSRLACCAVVWAKPSDDAGW